MGNNPSAALAAANAKSGLNNALKDVNKQLGLDGGEEKDDEKRKAVGCANRAESELRRKERETEYRQKQLERQMRKEKLAAKWNKSHEENADRSESSSK
jgi:hypothetical protein